MSKKILEVLFDSKTRVKILKYLFRNSNEHFTLNEISRIVQEDSKIVRKEVSKLLEIGLLKKHQ